MVFNISKFNFCNETNIVTNKPNKKVNGYKKWVSGCILLF